MQITEWTHTKTGKVFIGNQYEVMDYFELSQTEFRKLRKLGVIQKRSLKLNEVSLERILKKQKTELEKEKKLKRQASREYYLQRALSIESQNRF